MEGMGRMYYFSSRPRARKMVCMDCAMKRGLGLNSMTVRTVCHCCGKTSYCYDYPKGKVPPDALSVNKLAEIFKQPPKKELKVFQPHEKLPCFG